MSGGRDEGVSDVSEEEAAFLPSMPRGWFMGHPFFRWYMFREATSVFLTAYALDLGIGWLCLVRGPEAWETWRAVHAHPLGLAWTAVALGFSLVHTVTWFQVAPKAAPQVIRGRQVSARLVTGSLWALFVGVSVAVILVGVL